MPITLCLVIMRNICKRVLKETKIKMNANSFAKRNHVSNVGLIQIFLGLKRFL